VNQGFVPCLGLSCRGNLTHFGSCFARRRQSAAHSIAEFGSPEFLTLFEQLVRIWSLAAKLRAWNSNLAKLQCLFFQAPSKGLYLRLSGCRTQSYWRRLVSADSTDGGCCWRAVGTGSRWLFCQNLVCPRRQFVGSFLHPE